jgi:hypothetical protein
MPLFRFKGTMRYTRISCMPFRAVLGIAKLVQAHDEADALRQAVHCLDRDLEELLAQVNAINLSHVRLEVHSVEPEPAADGDPLWNPTVFPKLLALPPHIAVSQPRP